VTEANVATLRAGYEALNRGDLSEVIALIDDDITFDPGPLSPDSDASARGRDGFRALVQSWLDAFDEFRIEPLDVAADGDKLSRPCVSRGGAEGAASTSRSRSRTSGPSAMARRSGSSRIRTCRPRGRRCEPGNARSVPAGRLALNPR
jgi:ketosteroid isomerase-like protein